VHRASWLPAAMMRTPTQHAAQRVKLRPPCARRRNMMLLQLDSLSPSKPGRLRQPPWGGGQALLGRGRATRAATGAHTGAASRPCLAAAQAQRRTALGADGAPINCDPGDEGVIARRVPLRLRLQLPACGARGGTGFRVGAGIMTARRVWLCPQPQLPPCRARIIMDPCPATQLRRGQRQSRRTFSLPGMATLITHQRCSHTHHAEARVRVPEIE